MSEGQRGVILYGYEVEAVAQALQGLDPRYAESGRVPVVRCRDGAEADAAREAAPTVVWLVVELHQPGKDLPPARDVRLWLNTSTLDVRSAARAIDQPDLVTWYEVVDPVRVVTVDGGPARDDYSNLTMIVPEGNRTVAHAVRVGGTPPPCLPAEAELVLPTDDLWVLRPAPTPGNEVCPACEDRHS